MTYEVVFSPEAEEQLLALYQYIAVEAYPEVAKSYVESIIQHCERFAIFPLRGTPRDDVRPGLRVTHYKKRTIIAFTVDAISKKVAVLGIFYGGQDYESSLDIDTAE